LPTQDALELCDRLFAAIASGKVEAVRDLYARDAKIWHNYDGVVQSVEENLRVLGWVVENVGGLRYEEIRRQSSERGFVQQHVLRGTTRRGEPLEVPACLVAEVERGKITRIDEYIDSAHLGPLLRARG
jgi:ketosteroid isomerase-like protein